MQRKPTERQKFVVELAEKGLPFDQIGLKYQERFGTKEKLSRQKIRMMIASLRPFGAGRAEFWEKRQENALRRIQSNDRSKQAGR